MANNYDVPDARVFAFLPDHRLLDNITSNPTGTGDDWVVNEED